MQRRAPTRRSGCKRNANPISPLAQRSGAHVPSGLRTARKRRVTASSGPPTARRMARGGQSPRRVGGRESGRALALREREEKEVALAPRTLNARSERRISVGKQEGDSHRRRRLRATAEKTAGFYLNRYIDVSSRVSSYFILCYNI